MTHPYAKGFPEQYQRSIDDETWAFIERTENFYPADTASRSIDEQRKVYTALCHEFDTGLPGTVTATDLPVPSTDASDWQVIPCRQYTHRASVPTAAGKEPVAIVYLHGGGFVVGGLDSHHSVCADLCDQTGLTVLSVDYRLSPEHLHPAAFNDTCDCVQWAADNLADNIIVCGDSAGGNLAAAASHFLRGQRSAPIAQVLIYPGLGGDTSTGSYQQHQFAPMLTLADILFFQGVRFAPADASINQKVDVTANPLLDTDFTLLPRTMVVSAQCDPLCDDGKQYCESINQANDHSGKQLSEHAQFTAEPGLVHGYLRARNSVKRASDSFQRIVTGIQTLAADCR